MNRQAVQPAKRDLSVVPNALKNAAASSSGSCARSPRTPIRSPYGGLAIKIPACSVGALISCASICLSGTSKAIPALVRLLRVMTIASPEISLPKIKASLMTLGDATSALIACHSASSKLINFSNAKDRLIPGGMPATICAASTNNVPEPHIGSSSGTPGFQPATRNKPADRFSRKGASPVSSRQPRLNKGSPEVSR